MPLPDWLLWLLPVPISTCAAMAWASWSSRTRGPADPADSVRAYERFRAALAAPVPAPRRSGSSTGVRRLPAGEQAGPRG